MSRHGADYPGEVILAIDTSLGTAVAVVEDDGLVRSATASGEALRHAEVIGDLLRGALAEASVSPPDISYVAAGMGPGPFTGLRIGIAAARTFALGCGATVVPVVSHDAIALDVLFRDAMTDAVSPRFAVVTDARRREMAFSVYDGIDDDGLPIRLTGPALVPHDEVDARIADGAAQRRDATVVPGAMVGLVAARAIAAGRTVGPAEPLYLRSPDVTLNSAPKRVSA